jgi:periplasmic protein TonB
MSAEQTLPTLDTAYALRPSLLAPAPRRQPIFWLALLIAAVVHVVLVVGLSRSQPRNLGDANGSGEAINVELVDEGELRAMGSQQRTEAPPVTPPASQPAEAEKAAPPTEEPAPAQPAPQPETETAAQEPAAALPAFETEEAKAAAPPEAQPKSAPPKSTAKSEKTPKKESEPKQESAEKPPPKTALKPPDKLDLAVPFDMSMQSAASAAGASSATRPAGITRSGANDRFGRDVIRALKKTMPPSDGVTGKVKVRIFLNERGNVAWVHVVNSSGDRLLDDSVVFSVRQSLFPFPPKGATEADRTFLVTYIYR